MIMTITVVIIDNNNDNTEGVFVVKSHCVLWCINPGTRVSSARTPTPTVELHPKPKPAPAATPAP